MGVFMNAVDKKGGWLLASFEPCDVPGNAEGRVRLLILASPPLGFGTSLLPEQLFNNNEEQNANGTCTLGHSAHWSGCVLRSSLQASLRSPRAGEACEPAVYVLSPDKRDCLL